MTLQPHQVSSDLQINSQISLTSEQRHYLSNVLRLEVNAEFIALDRLGGWWLAQLGKDFSKADIIAKLETNSELAIPISLGVAMPKGSNLESIIRQTTELGVQQISPLFSDRTIIKSGTEIGNQKRDRWQRIAEEAAELSLRSHIPEIKPPLAFLTWLAYCATLPPTHGKYICVTTANGPHLLTSLQNTNSIEQVIVATGCEGGWTTREEAMAIAAGFSPVSLGDRVLSAVTAPVVALSIVGAFFDTQTHHR